MSRELSNEEYCKICDEINRLIEDYRTDVFAVEALEKMRFWCEEENVEDKQEQFYDIF